MEIRETILTYLREECFISPNTGGFGNYGCMDPLAYNYDWQATDPCGSVIPDPLGGNCVGDVDWNGPGTSPGDCCCGCKDPMADNYCVNCVGDCDGCGYPPPTPLGLGDPTSCCNYPTPILGCTDPTACNYISTANTDDGSCEYISCLGCTDTTAANYNPAATIDDGSCTYGITGCTDTTACNYDVNATVDDGSCCYDQNGGPCTGTPLTLIDVVGCMTEGSTITITWAGGTDCDNIYLSYNSGGVTVQTIIWNTTNTGSYSWTVPIGLSPTNDYYFYIANDNPNGSPTEWNYGNDWNICEIGCTDSTACNYNANAGIDDGSCEYTSCAGCTDSTAFNYDANATIDDGSCKYKIKGCTDPLAFNYDATATIDDGSCKYKPLECKNLEKGCWVCKKDPDNFTSCQQITTANILTSALSYGLPGFTTQQDCINNTPCGITDNNTPCGKLDNYVMINYANWQGMGPLDTVHFCEKCKYQGLNDPMCECCKEDPCNKKSFIDTVYNEFNLEIKEFCKYCTTRDISDKSCKCCKRFEKTK